MDKIKRIREAMASGKPILAESEKSGIIEYTKIIGTDGELPVEKLLAQVQ
jgi:hypothetical protein